MCISHRDINKFSPFSNTFCRRRSFCPVYEISVLEIQKLHLVLRLSLCVKTIVSVWYVIKLKLICSNICQVLHETLQVINRTMKWTNLPTFFTQYKSLQEIQGQNDDCDKHSSYEKIHLKGPTKAYSTNLSFNSLFIASGNLPTLLKKVQSYEILCRCSLQPPC